MSTTGRSGGKRAHLLARSPAKSQRPRRIGSRSAGCVRSGCSRIERDKAASGRKRCEHRGGARRGGRMAMGPGQVHGGGSCRSDPIDEDCEVPVGQTTGAIADCDAPPNRRTVAPKRSTSDASSAEHGKGSNGRSTDRHDRLGDFRCSGRYLHQLCMTGTAVTLTQNSGKGPASRLTPYLYHSCRSHGDCGSGSTRKVAQTFSTTFST